jgi:hypothetical protein
MVAHPSSLPWQSPAAEILEYEVQKMHKEKRKPEETRNKHDPSG